MMKELIVARKEFNDFLTSKRFLLILGALALLSIVGIIAGISDYNSQLDTYREALQSATGSQFPGIRMTDMPSVLLVFQNINSYFLIIGLALAVSMGFDLISREKEDGSLKSLLTHPVFRDSIINGKAIGSVAMLTLVIGAMFLLTLSIMLFSGLVPTSDDLVRIAIYFVMTLLYCVVLFAVSLAMSTFAKNSSLSVAFTLGILLAVVLLPMLSTNVVGLVMGESPQAFSISQNQTSVNRDQVFQAGPGNMTGSQPISMQINPEYTQYWNTRNGITGLINMVSPLDDFQSISQVLLEKQSSPTSTFGDKGGGMVIVGRFDSSSDISAATSITSVIGQIVSLIVMGIAALAASYLKFMRLDVR